MRSILITLLLASAVAPWFPRQAPVKPDFSGTWKLDPAASVVAPAPGASGGVSPALLEPVIVQQTAETLSVTQKPGDDSFTFTYRLDGSTSTLAWPSGPGETVEATAVAKWDSDKLQIATSIPIKGVVYKNTETWSLTRNRLTIELVTSRGKQVRVYSLVRDRERENPRSAPTPAVMLPSSTDCWEPAIAMGPREQVYIVAGQRRGALASKEFDQQQVLWRSFDGGATFEGPWPLDAKGHRQADQRIAVDRDGTIYVTYMDHEDLNPGASTRLRVARSHDEGRTFVAESIPVTQVSDKPELAVSPDGKRIAVVYESSPGHPYALLLKSSTDAGRTWSASRVVSAAARPQSNDVADHDFPSIAANGETGVCVVWVDDRRGALDTVAQCSTDGAKTWGDDVVLSNRSFTSFYGHYGGAAISSRGRLFVVWAEGERDYRTGTVWFNSVPLGH